LADEAAYESLAGQDELEYESEQDDYPEVQKTILYSLNHYECDGGGFIGIFSSELAAQQYATKLLKDQPGLLWVFDDEPLPKWTRETNVRGQECLAISTISGYSGGALVIQAVEMNPDFKTREQRWRDRVL
jgi:hypothetical protein